MAILRTGKRESLPNQVPKQQEPKRGAQHSVRIPGFGFGNRQLNRAGLVVLLDKPFGFFLGWKKPARSFAGYRIRSRDLDAPVVSRGIEKRGHFLSRDCCALLRKEQSEMADLATFIQDRGYLKSAI